MGATQDTSNLSAIPVLSKSWKTVTLGVSA